MQPFFQGALDNGISNVPKENGIGQEEPFGRFGIQPQRTRTRQTHSHQKMKHADIEWVRQSFRGSSTRSSNARQGNGVAISMRDSGVPRRSYINRIIELAKESEIPFQLEVESAGGSDGNALQRSPYPFDWCFIGAPEDNVHSPNEKVHKTDIDAMTNLYSYLMKKL